MQINQAKEYPAEAKALRAQLQSFFTQHQSAADDAMLAEEARRPQVADSSDPYDLLE